MRLKFIPTALLALACLNLCSSQLHALAKPTRPLAHDSTHRLVVTASMRPSASGVAVRRPATTLARANHTAPLNHSIQRISQGAAASRITASPLHPMAAPARHPQTAADLATLERVHAWEQAQRNVQSGNAARSAIAAADRSPYLVAANHTVPTPSRISASRPESGELGDFDDDPSESVAPSNPATPARLTAPELPSIQNIDETATTVLLPSLYDSRGRLVIPPPLYGSRDVLLHQNQMADRDGLSRVQDDDELLELRRQNQLVALPENEGIHVDEGLPADRRFSRPWTADFLAILGRDFYATFHSQLLVDSAVRTVEIQKHLLRINGNAAPAFGDTASPHLTGQAVDLAKHGLSRVQIAWMRTYLQPLIQQGKIDVEEEFQQSCFHISVYRNFAPTPAHVAAVPVADPPAE
jgi:hypothetical protein